MRCTAGMRSANVGGRKVGLAPGTGWPVGATLDDP